MEMLQEVALERYSNRGTNILSGLRRAGDEMFNVGYAEEYIFKNHCMTNEEIYMRKTS